MNGVASNFTLPSILDKSVLFIILLVSLVIHEWAHAFCADQLGDPLPRKEGRVTLDPRSHVDLIGTLLIPFIMIFLNPGFLVLGWGKPVRISLPNKLSQTRDDILITLAGPAANLLLAFSTVLVFCLINFFSPLSEAFIRLMIMIVNLNCLLFLFNLIPIPPLDGSHLLKRLLKISETNFNKFSSFGIFLLLILVNLDEFRVPFQDVLSYLTHEIIGILL